MTSERRLYVALALYGVLGLLVWMAIGYMPIRVAGREIDFRVVPSVILGLFALRTILFRRDERMRAE